MLNTPMKINAAIVIMLGLLVQWVAMTGALASREECREVFSTVQCDCCDGPATCGCSLQEGDPSDPSPLPTLPESIKLPALKPGGNAVVPSFIAILQRPRVFTRAPAWIPPGGYAGVSMSVAFCSFVI